MKCAAFRSLIQDELDGTLSTDGANALRDHLLSCESCRFERETMRAIDSALGTDAPARAPAWLETSVLNDIRTFAHRRRRTETVVLGVACGTAAVAAGFGVSRAMSWDAVRLGAVKLLTAARDLSAPLADPLERAPDLVTMWSQEPGAVGFMLALAAAATAFLTISALRAAKQFSLEWR